MHIVLQYVCMAASIRTYFYYTDGENPYIIGLVWIACHYNNIFPDYHDYILEPAYCIMNILYLNKLTLTFSSIALLGDVPDHSMWGRWCKMAESVVKYSYNGTEYCFVSNDPAQIEDLKCPICFELVFEPVLTSCGHLFCQGCVKDQTRCPTCRDELQYMRNQRDERKVIGLKVKCLNWERGCQWQGDLGDTAYHTGKNCQMETVPCPKGCREVIARGLLQEHGKACPQRDYKCPHCPFADTFVEVTTTHFTDCELFPLACPAGCCNSQSRGEMAIHLTSCAEELVPCKYAAIGCTEVMKRKDLQTHLQDKKDYHLENSMDMVMQHNMVLAEITATLRMMATGAARCDTSHILKPLLRWLQNTPTSYPRPPWVIKIEGFQKKKEKNETWFSDPVYSHFGGYKMCLSVDANGNGSGRSTHVSVYVHLMRGDNDDNLKWPFKGTIKVSLLNQLEDGQHYTKGPWSPDYYIPEDTSGRVTEGERAVKGCGYSKFICHQDLAYKGDKNCQYLKDNTLFFRVDCFELKLD